MIQHASMTLNLNALIAAILDVCSGQTSITELDEELSSILILKNEEIKLRIISDLEIYIDDNSSSWLMQPDGEYSLSIPSGGSLVSEVSGELDQIEAINAQNSLLDQLSESF